jgi:hypothetical protein
MALLVCLMTQNTKSAPSAADTDRKLAQLHSSRLAQNQLAELQRQRESLERRGSEQRKLLEAMQIGASRADTDEVVKLTLDQQQKRLSLAEHEQKLQAAEVLADQFREKLDGLEVKATDTKRAVEAAMKQFREQKERQTIRARMPFAHATPKKQAGFILCHKKLRQIHHYDADGETAGYNAFDLRPAILRDEISPDDFNPLGGITIDDSAISIATLNTRLRPLSPTRHYVAIALWPDSYLEFRILRDHLLKLGFEYELILVGDENAISLGRGGNGRVQ